MLDPGRPIPILSHRSSRDIVAYRGGSAVSAQRFRQDLLFRLNVHILRVPPLRERLSDLPELADHLVAAICEKFGARRKAIAPAALELLARYDWARNNVRELRNAVERMVIDSDGDVVGPEHVPSELIGSGGERAAASEARTFVERKAEAERQIVVEALERNEWHITRTAEELGLADHASLLKIMRRHGVSRR